MAVATVFGVPELHEAILYHADMTTLLVSAPRVSKTWRKLIDAAPMLQRKLFFLPIPGDAHQGAAVNDTRGGEDQLADAPEDLGWAVEALPPLTLNPLLVKYFSPCFFETHEKAYFRQANAFMSMPWTPNPRKENLDKAGVMRSMELQPPEHAYVQPFRERFFHSGASWRRMLVTQPPTRQLGCLWSNETVEGNFVNSQYVAVIDGTHVTLDSKSPSQVLRMGQLYDLVQERLCRHESYCLWFRVHWDTMREPAYCEASQTLGAQLIARSRVVVEFLEQKCSRTIAKEPSCPRVFDDVFRCDEHKEVEVAFTNDSNARRVTWPKQHREGMLSKFAAVYDKREQTGK